MGVRGLWPLLEPVGETCPLSALAGSTVAVDLAGWVVEAETSVALANSVSRPYLRNLVRPETPPSTTTVVLWATARLFSESCESDIICLWNRGLTLKTASLRPKHFLSINPTGGKHIPK